jgi:histidinol phosphatase-like enzyme (inositol monophosphatase family)
MVESCPSHLVTLAQRLADASGSVVRRYFRSGVAIADKADQSPVTVADRDAENLIRTILTAQRPKDGIWGEEHGTVNLEADYVWVIDPIDGTKAFVTGRPTFGTLIGLLHCGRPILGIIDQPVLGDRWIGAIGRPTTFNGQPARCRRGATLLTAATPATATLGATTPAMFQSADLEAFNRVSAAARFTIYGGDCYAYGLLASGFQDLVIEADLKLHDYAALVPVVTGAGGVMTDWSGAALDGQSDGRVVAAGDADLHAAALALLQGGDYASAAASIA